MFLGDPLVGDYVINLKKGTFSDVWDDVSADRNYGCGTLNTALNANDLTIVINTRGFVYDQFKNGDKICVTSQANPDDITGEIEYHRIDQEPTWNGDEVTIHIATQLSYAYPVSRTVDDVVIKTRVASCIEFGDVEGTISTSDKTTAHGTVDETQIIVILYHVYSH